MGGNTSKGAGLDVSLGRPSALGFHHAHSENIALSRNGTCAKRVESFCKGICFSNRPVRVGERVYLRFAETSTSWSGVLRFGFTNNDPQTTNVPTLPRYACPDLTVKPGYWAKALGERYAEANNVLDFYLTRNGDVIYSINGENKGLFFSGVNTNLPCWVLLDIYGNTVSVEFFEGAQSYSQLTTGTSPQSRDHLPVARDHHTSVVRQNIEVRHHANVIFAALPFHSTMGRNVQLSSDRTVAARLTEEYCNGYVFTSRPLRCGEKIVVQILGIEHVYVGGLAVGLTACDPATIRPIDLPDDSDLLLDRKEYWVVNKDVCNNAEIGDELSITLTNEGEVHYGKNGHHVTVLMHVDKTTPLWAFFDIYGNTQRVKMLGVAKATRRPRRPVSDHTLDNSSNLRVELPPPIPSGRPSSSTLDITPPPRPPPVNRSLSMTATGSHYPGENSAPTPPPRPPSSKSLPTSPISSPDSGMCSECTVCFENNVDCVLYTCGHMCMCYECAVMVKQEKSGLCPICRQVIKDVIKTYRT